MYITNITHCLDENGNIAAGMNVSGRRMASFHLLDYCVIGNTQKNDQSLLHQKT